MKKYLVFKHPDNRLYVVKDGFCIPGLIFGCFWLFWHKIWIHGSVAFLLGFGVYSVFPTQTFGIADILSICVSIAVGILGNDWFAQSLTQRGFQRVGTVNATTTDGAKAKYLSGETLDYNF